MRYDSVLCEEENNFIILNRAAGMDSGLETKRQIYVTC